MKHYVSLDLVKHVEDEKALCHNKESTNKENKNQYDFLGILHRTYFEFTCRLHLINIYSHTICICKGWKVKCRGSLLYREDSR